LHHRTGDGVLGKVSKEGLCVYFTLYIVNALPPQTLEIEWTVDDHPGEGFRYTDAPKELK
jgi:hypothetical protein